MKPEIFLLVLVKGISTYCVSLGFRKRAADA